MMHAGLSRHTASAELVFKLTKNTILGKGIPTSIGVIVNDSEAARLCLEYCNAGDSLKFCENIPCVRTEPGGLPSFLQDTQKRILNNERADTNTIYMDGCTPGGFFWTNY